MIDKTKVYIKQNIRRLSDVRVLGQMVFGLIVVMISWSGVKAIQTNYELQKQISEISQQNSVQNLQNENLRLQNEYLKTDEYLELAARQHFGKGMPGEKVLIVPKAVALAHTTIIQSATKQPAKPGDKPQYQKNLESWGRFFFKPDQNKL